MDHDKLQQKKQELDNYRPLPQALVQNLEDWFRVELTYTSNAIEGNTLTRQETALVLEKGLTVGGKMLKEHLEATNHAEAFNWIQSLVEKTLQDLGENDILSLHSLILKGIDDACAGHYRSVSVRIAGSAVILPNPRKVPELMVKLIEKIHHSRAGPVKRAAEAHYALVTIHPFVDGNGRTARLLMNLILMMQGYPPAIIRKRDRLSYLNALEKAQLGGSQDDYFELIAKAVERSLDIYLHAVKGENTVLEEKRPSKTTLLKIGDLSKIVQETVPTIRFWTKKGLLEVVDTTPSGYSLFNHAMIKRVEKIKDLKKQRYTLDEIKALLPK